MPKDLDNGSLDGTFREFTIMGRKITAWNICHRDLHEIMLKNRSYYDAYQDNLIAENALLDLAEKIADLLIDCAPEMAQVLQSIDG